MAANGLVDESLYRALKVELGVREAAPVIEAFVVALELDGQPLRVLGVDVFAEAPFRSFLGGSAVTKNTALGAFLTQPDAMLIGAGAAQRHGLSAGSALTLRVGDMRKRMRVAGVIEAGDDASRRAMDGMAIVDLAAAQTVVWLARQTQPHRSDRR